MSFFDQDGKQIKGDFASDGYYYSKNSGDRVDLGQNHYQNINNNWYYIGNDWQRLTGEQVIDGVLRSTSIVLVSRPKETLLKTIHFTIKIVVPALRDQQFVDLNGKILL